MCALFDSELQRLSLREDVSTARRCPMENRADLDPDEREEVLDALRRDGALLGNQNFLERYGYDMTCDHEVVLTAVQHDGSALQFAAEALQANREIVLAAMQSDPHALHWASEDLRKDREVVLTAVQNFGSALKHASEDLRKHREVVLTAVQNYGDALEYASEDLRKDREVVLTAVQQDEGAIRFAADELLEDASFATQAKRQFYLLKLSMLSARSTVVPAGDYWDVSMVLERCRHRLGLADDGATMELWHGSEKVATTTPVPDWPGIQPMGEITEYQLVLTR